MPINDSRIHRHLGIVGQSLRFEHIAAAVNDALREDRDLDWKVKLPDAVASDRWDEFAKDVAAMANSLGGLLVFGIADAPHLVGLTAPADERLLRGLQQRLLNHLDPYVHGEQFERLREEPASGRELLVVQVPPSQDAPHFVIWNPGPAARTAPERRGSDTDYMDAAGIEAAYLRRQIQRGSTLARLEELEKFALDQCTSRLAGESWAVLTAAPTRTAMYVEPIARTAAYDILLTALGEGSAIAPNEDATVLQDLGVAAQNPRTGYRQWVISNFMAIADRTAGRPVYVELHQDGAVVLAMNASWRLNSSSGWDVRVDTGAVQRAVAEFVALVRLHASDRTTDDMALRASITTGEHGSNRPLVPVDRDAQGRPDVRGWSRQLVRPQPVKSAFPSGPDDRNVGLAAWELASGLLNQFGLDTSIARPVMA